MSEEAQLWPLEFIYGTPHGAGGYTLESDGLLHWWRIDADGKRTEWATGFFEPSDFEPVELPDGG